MSEPMQTALFEDNYFQRSHGPVVTQPDVALTELVANAWDAGATIVKVTLPEGGEDELVVEDDGVGMTETEFDKRWRTLVYNRHAHQGDAVEFPPGVQRHARTAYGRNGIGRHAMFCFAEVYEVHTTKGGRRASYRVAEASGESPWRIAPLGAESKGGHGTVLRCRVTRNRPAVDEMRQVLSARFLYDPEFTLLINGEAVALENHSGLLLVQDYPFHDGLMAKMYVVDAAESARTKFQHGVAFWVSRRLVGKPGWTLAERSLLDGRTKEAKRLTFIVEVDALHDQVKADWTGFKVTPAVTALESATAELVDRTLRDMLSGRVEAKVQGIIEDRRDRVRKLDPLAQLEVVEFAHDVVARQPLVPDEVLAAAVDALIRLDDTRSGQALIQKLAKFTPGDVESLNRLLDEWTVRDALAVLDEVGKRMRVVEAIGRLAKDPAVDELHTLHPLVTHARWLFGPEFDSPCFISNTTIRRAVERIAGTPVAAAGFENPKKRPDLLFLAGSTISATGVEGWGRDGLLTIETILLLELKRGGATIGRAEMAQAQEYVEELLASGDIPGSPRIVAFVVGARVDADRAPARDIKDRNDVPRGALSATSFDRLVDTANRRLFRLQEAVEPFFPEGADSTLIQAALRQQSLL